MEQELIGNLSAQIFDLMGEKLRVKGKDLRGRVRKAGRLLPKSVRRAADELIDAQIMAENPNLMRRLDADAIGRAHTTCLRYLKQIDPQAAKSRARYNIAALISAQFLLIVGVAIAVMQWRDLI